MASLLEDSAEVHRICREALEQIARGDGLGIATLRDLFHEQLSAFHARYDLGGFVELGDFVSDRVIELYDAYIKTSEPVRNPLHWCRRVLRLKSIDVLRARANSPGQDPLDEAQLRSAAHDFGSPGDLELLRATLAPMLEELGEEVRRALFLVHLRGFSCAGAGRRMLEAARVPDQAWRELLEKVADRAEFREAKLLRLGDAESVLFSLDEDEWERLLRSCGVAAPDAADLKKARTHMNNRLRSGRYRFHQWAVQFLPEEPPEIRRIWKQRWTNEAKPPRTFAETATELGYPPAAVREYQELARIYASVLLEWDRDDEDG